MDKDGHETARWLRDRTKAAFELCWKMRQGASSTISQALWGLILFDICTSALIGGWRSWAAKSASVKVIGPEYSSHPDSHCSAQTATASLVGPCPVQSPMPKPSPCKQCLGQARGNPTKKSPNFITEEPRQRKAAAQEVYGSVTDVPAVLLMPSPLGRQGAALP